ncbi:hypothetical protein SBRCBS47491_008685 [Sporothrix bragantina]|uniref:NDT80 domain-containing protein n=1 Tax=Sporothrix bragantina TaxID=671064 RepID=A0ABP0CNI8_9PEZI
MDKEYPLIQQQQANHPLNKLPAWSSQRPPLTPYTSSQINMQPSASLRMASSGAESSVHGFAYGNTSNTTASGDKRVLNPYQPWANNSTFRLDNMGNNNAHPDPGIFQNMHANSGFATWQTSFPGINPKNDNGYLTPGSLAKPPTSTIEKGKGRASGTSTMEPTKHDASQSSQAPLDQMETSTAIATASTDLVLDTESSSSASSASDSESTTSTAIVGPSAPGFDPPATGYEFELNHAGNLLELNRQKKWAHFQLRSCNENNRFMRTQTTACIIAVNGRIIGPYHPDSLYCYGTNPQVPSIRVTMTVYGNGEHGEPIVMEIKDDDEDAVLPVFRNATIVLKHQIIVAVEPRNRCNQRVSNAFSQQQIQAPSFSSPRSSIPTTMPVIVQPPAHALNNNNVSFASGNRARNDTGRSFSSIDSAISMGTSLSSASNAMPQRAVPSARNNGRRPSHQSTHRFSFATTTIPLHIGVATRPGYRPVNAVEAVERMRRWGGQPDRGVFGNGWLVHMAIEPGHVQHVVDTKVMEQVVRHVVRNGNGGAMQTAGGASPVQTMHMVNEHFAQLRAREGTMSVLLSNHSTQKRIARQCPDMVAMWVMAQENL